MLLCPEQQGHRLPAKPFRKQMAERIKGGTKRQDSNAGASEPRKHMPGCRTCSWDSGSLWQHLRAGWEGRRKAMGTAGPGRKAPETGRSWISAAPYKMHQRRGPGSSALLTAGASCPRHHRAAPYTGTVPSVLPGTPAPGVSLHRGTVGGTHAAGNSPTAGPAAGPARQQCPSTTGPVYPHVGL